MRGKAGLQKVLVHLVSLVKEFEEERVGQQVRQGGPVSVALEVMSLRFRG